MDAEEIFGGLDALSHSAMQLGEALYANDEFELEDCFNRSCVLVAERVLVSPEIRGSGAWKILFHLTMEKALETIRALPSQFYMKVFPLEFEGKVTDKNREEFKKAERKLELLYEIHLYAKRIDLPEDFGCFMQAPVPDHLHNVNASKCCE